MNQENLGELHKLLTQHKTLVQDQLTSSLQLSKTLTSDRLQGCLSQMSQNLSQIERKVKPIAQMAETVKVCKNNINTALDQINRVTESIAEHEDVVEILVERRAMINSEFEVYIKSMWRAQELSKYFKEELAYFRDSYAITEKLNAALSIALEECDQYLEANIKKLLDVSSKKHVKRFRELLKVLEACAPSEDDFKKYLKLYVEIRRSKLKSRLSQSSINLDKPIEIQLGEDRRSSVSGINSYGSGYERGQNPAISQLVDLADSLESELSFATTLFDDGTFAGYSALSLALKVSDKLIQRLAATFSDAEQELAKIDSWDSLRPIIMNADIMECVQEHMPKGFMQLIKVKELPLKKAWGDILLRSQQYIMKYLQVEVQEEEEEVDPTLPLQRLSRLSYLMKELSQFPKTYRMLEFIQRSIKDEAKRFSCMKNTHSNYPLVYNHLVDCIQLVEAQRDSLKKKHALKYQFVLNNYGLLLSHLEPVQSLYSLAKDGDQPVISEVRQSFEYHADQFSQYIWKDVRNAIKAGFEDEKMDRQVLSEEIQKRVDTILRKDFKRYQITGELSNPIKTQLKQTILKGIVSAYTKYLKMCKPQRAYKVEDIELSVEKLVKM